MNGSVICITFSHILNFLPRSLTLSWNLKRQVTNRNAPLPPDQIQICLGLKTGENIQDNLSIELRKVY